MNNAHFQRRGDAYAVSCGRLELRGEVCAGTLAQCVRVGNLEVGPLDVRMKVSSDGMKWETSSVSSLADVAFRATPSGGELDLWGEWWKKTGPWQIDGIAWRIHVRVQVRSGEDLPDVRLVEILNNGVKPLKVACASFVFGKRESDFVLPHGGVCLNPGDGQSHFQ